MPQAPNPRGPIARAAVVTGLVGVVEAVVGAVLGGLNPLLILGLVTMGLGYLVGRTQYSGFALIALVLAGGSLLVQFLLILVFFGAPLKVLFVLLAGMFFIAQGFVAAMRLAREQSTGVTGVEPREDPFDPPHA